MVCGLLAVKGCQVMVMKGVMMPVSPLRQLVLLGKLFKDSPELLPTFSQLRYFGLLVRALLMHLLNSRSPVHLFTTLSASTRYTNIPSQTLE